jgi:hypothetical protein
MEQRPPQPPEGRLIADAAERMDLSIREAARRAGISYGRWRQITSGVQHVSPGNFAAVRAPARTLARMALTVGITPDEMETQGQRPDAAEAMRAIPVLAPSPPPSNPSQPTPAVVAFARTCGVDPGDPGDPHLRPVRQEIADATLAYGAAATGRQIFHGRPWSLDEATVWDDAAIIRPDKELLIAATRALRDREEAARQNRSGRAGLALVTLARG